MQLVRPGGFVEVVPVAWRHQQEGQFVDKFRHRRDASDLVGSNLVQGRLRADH